MTDFRHSASLAEITAVATMPAAEAQQRSAELALTHMDVVAYYPATPPDAGRIARELQINITDEAAGEQPYVLAPTALGGIALWQPRERPQPARQPAPRRLLKAEWLY